MMTQDDLCYQSIRHLANLIAQRELSPVELTQAYLDRIDRIDPQLNSYISTFAAV
jgi:Asp-tRNA(Asn)/Glu-tRNA(Gln) amidotransferase A subunit family amidase